MQLLIFINASNARLSELIIWRRPPILVSCKVWIAQGVKSTLIWRPAARQLYSLLAQSYSAPVIITVKDDSKDNEEEKGRLTDRGRKIALLPIAPIANSGSHPPLCTFLWPILE